MCEIISDVVYEMIWRDTKATTLNALSNDESSERQSIGMAGAFSSLMEMMTSDDRYVANS